MWFEKALAKFRGRVRGGPETEVPQRPRFGRDRVESGHKSTVIQSTQIGAVNSWLRNQPAEVVSAVVASLREALAPYADGASVRLPGAMWLISSASA